MNKKFNIEGKNVFISGHTGMVGKAVEKQLKKENCNILKASREELDLTRQKDVEDWMSNFSPDVVIICAAKVGGIAANDNYPADFIYENLVIESNLINSSFKSKVSKLIFLGSSCIYPKNITEPIKEDQLMSGLLEKTNQWYAIAKIAGIKLCQAYRKQHGSDFISIMPSNMYGPGDNYDLETSHVLPALLRKCHEAKVKNSDFVQIWGSGNVRREFLHVNDCAKAIIFLLKYYSDFEHINVGTGSDMTILELLEELKKVTNYNGKIKLDLSKPDGTQRKLLNIEKILGLGWKPSISLKKGLEDVYEDFLKNKSYL